MSTKTIIPVDQERAFTPQELFFSTTDPKGIITFGNEVFTRISGHENSILIGAPHSIIRHPDMPRCVFQLLWLNLRQGITTVAYVKNLAANGHFYWVTAIITPIPNGYLSIRLKPTSPLLQIVGNLYKQLLQTETEIIARGETSAHAMAASRPQLDAALLSLGFPTYDAFMQHALLIEVAARNHLLPPSSHPTHDDALVNTEKSSTLQQHCEKLSVQVHQLYNSLASFLTLEKALDQQAALLQTFGTSLKFISLNAQIRTAALQTNGRTLQVVAQQMSRIAANITQTVSEVCHFMHEVTAILRAAAFHIAASELSTEMMRSFLRELHNADSPDSRHRVALLAHVVTQSVDSATRIARDAATRLLQLGARLEEFIKQIRTLEILHISGKIEAVSCTATGLDATLTAVFEEVRARTNTARTDLTTLMELAANARIKFPNNYLLATSLEALRAA